MVDPQSHGYFKCSNGRFLGLILNDLGYPHFRKPLNGARKTWISRRQNRAEIPEELLDADHRSGYGLSSEHSEHGDEHRSRKGKVRPTRVNTYPLVRAPASINVLAHVQCCPRCCKWCCEFLVFFHVNFDVLNLALFFSRKFWCCKFGVFFSHVNFDVVNLAFYFLR